MFVHYVHKEKNPPAKKLYQSSITIFMAFSMIDHTGAWKNASMAKGVPAKLKYCFRSVVLFEMLIKTNQLSYQDEISLQHLEMTDDEDVDAFDEDEEDDELIEDTDSDSGEM